MYTVYSIHTCTQYTVYTHVHSIQYTHMYTVHNIHTCTQYTVYTHVDSFFLRIFQKHFHRYFQQIFKYLFKVCIFRNPFQLFFEGTVGNSYLSDIAIDAIHILNGKKNEKCSLSRKYVLHRINF